jgi:hypothetical protein
VGLERAQERVPERSVLGVTDVEPEHLTTPSAATPVAIMTAGVTTRRLTRDVQ